MTAPEPCWNRVVRCWRRERRRRGRGWPDCELASDNATFVIVYDGQHHVLASSAELFGSVPNVPPGVLDDAMARGEDRVTWQPTVAIRQAIVAGPWTTATSQGVVLAGTSLTATESRTSELREWVRVS